VPPRRPSVNPWRQPYLRAPPHAHGADAAGRPRAAGAYGHPDHVAISQLTAAAVLCAADQGYRPADGLAAHRVSKLYHRAFAPAELERYQRVFGRLAMEVDGVERGALAWPAWSATLRNTTNLGREATDPLGNQLGNLGRPTTPQPPARTPRAVHVKLRRRSARSSPQMW
jgi:hypothetical protein